MAGSVERKLQELGIVLPTPPAPVANYVPTVCSGNLLFCAGQISAAPGGETIKGKLGAEVDLARGQAAARICAINLLAQVKTALGDLDRVRRCVRMGGFVNATPSFGQIPQVDGASDLIVAVFGDAGRHARTAVGVAELPNDASVEVDAIFEVA
jgi:enamine deaminase RidA (YjgF/YER057c/UK114 family)